ncbi:probable cytochrome P450 9f2 [Bradysia coprophila]|uniref:probable cytochrome P450 9f2 n=1 Tax=Bradysia coprophila TaxID=38358 RepID=UPI00187DCFF0|nr:probable cytochrome P450 9f2 [Bradysia coprophila]
MFLFIGFAVAYVLYKWLTKNDDYFLKKGIPYEKPLPLVGNFLGFMLQRETLIDVIQRKYDKFKKSKIFGLFNFNQIGYIVTDADLIKRITIKDFDHFVNHDQNFDNIDRVFSKSLFSLHNQQWREMRTILSPIFTSSKMKMMFGLLSNHVSDFMIHFNRKAAKDVDVYDIFSRFTADGIATAALGFEGDCVKNENSEIFKIVKQSLADFTKFTSVLKFLLVSIAPKLYDLLGYQLVNSNVVEFLRHVTIDTMRDREENNITRPDVIQLLLEVRKGKGQLKSKEDEVNDDELRNFSAHQEFNVSTNKSTTSLNINDDDLWIAQTFIFFVAGFNTTSHLLQTLTYELAKNQDIQQELFQEIQEVVSSLDGKPITYEALHKMKYLDCVISEGLRMYPPAVQSDRCCSKPIDLDLGNGKTLHVNKGEVIGLPIYNIQHDPDYFPNPETFDPTRFNDENKSSIVAGSYLPFGMGQRACIGSRFALMESKLLVFNLLSNYKIEPSSTTPDKLTFKADLTASVKETIYLKFKARN